jgi:hypothetical protein
MNLRLILVVLWCVILAAGCARTLNEVRAEPPALQLPPIAEQHREAMARCTQDRIYEEMGFVWSIVQETRREPDGGHCDRTAKCFPYIRGLGRGGYVSLD